MRTSSAAVKGEAMRHHDVSWNVVAQLLGTSFATLESFKGHIRKCWFIYTYKYVYVHKYMCMYVHVSNAAADDK